MSADNTGICKPETLAELGREIANWDPLIRLFIERCNKRAVEAMNDSTNWEEVLKARGAADELKKLMRIPKRIEDLRAEEAQKAEAAKANQGRKP